MMLLTRARVELLLEHQSMSSIESFARIALALRNDRIVSSACRCETRRSRLGTAPDRPNALHDLRHDRSRRS